jgi:hypothetical protein
MMVHRLLDRYLKGGRSAMRDKYEELCRHSSDMEQLAASAERASIKYKQVEFLSERLGQVYDGVISGVTEWGLYVEINENKCEGMVPIRDLDDDYYVFDEKNYCLIGKRNGGMYRLGDPIKIQVARTNMERKIIDFALVKVDDAGNLIMPVIKERPKPKQPIPPVAGKGKRGDKGKGKRDKGAGKSADKGSDKSKKSKSKARAKDKTKGKPKRK